MIGKSLGHYEVLEPLGSGGMGDVYRAHDTTLDRDVAIKVLPEDLSDDADRLARLKREAHLLAVLNHPNVATIHGFEESNGTRFLVMELVKGESLEQRLAAEGGRGLPVDEALDTCRQIAEALEAAHEEGIIHRDLKPANVLITPEGRAKVLDFGLAKTVERPDYNSDLSRSPTITIAGTEAGVILGTAPYMSPEQVRGKPLDKRADIWAFGCVLYETLAGSRAFNRETVADTLAAILEVEPPWDALPNDTPAIVRALLGRCLRKDAKRRLRDVGDARIEIEEALNEPAGGLPDVDAAATGSSPLRRALPWGVVGVASGALIASVIVWSLTRSTPPVTYVDLNLPPGTYLSGGHPNEARIGGNRPSRTAFALTPDGRSAVFAATDGQTTQLYRRRLSDPQPTPIPGTEGGTSPILSPGGESVGFFAEGEIRVVPIEGGTARVVVTNVWDYDYGMSWAGDWIAYTRPEQGIFRIPATGGSPEQISIRDPVTQLHHSLPHLLPGGNTFLYSVLKARFEWRNADIMAQRVGEEPKVLIENGADARYLPTGHVIFAREGVLWAAAFDPESLELTGPEVRVMDDVMQSVGVGHVHSDTAAAQVSFSASGSLLFARGGVHPEAQLPLVWVSVSGDGVEVEPVAGVPAGTALTSFPRISPDKRKIAYSGPERVYEREIVVLDLETGGVEQTDLPGRQSEPAWSPGGDRLAFVSAHDGPSNIYWIPADDLLNADPRPITTGGAYKYLADWSANNVLLYLQEGEDGGTWTIDFSGDGQVTRFSEELASWAMFSPDGNWIAYCRPENGQWEIYVAPYPAGTPVYPVTSGDGGARPAWSRDGTALFYRTGRRYREKMMAVDIDLGRVPPISQGTHTHRELFSRYMVGPSPVRGYDVSEDGRFLMVENWDHPPQPVTGLVLAMNWAEELKRLVPAGR